MAFRIDLEDLGTDEDGDTVQSPLFAQTSMAEARGAEKLTPQLSAAVGILRDMSTADGSGLAPDGSGARAVDKAAWIEAMKASDSVCASDKANSRRTGVLRVVQKLNQLGVIRVDDGLVWLAGGGQSDAAQAKALEAFADVNFPNGQPN